jgi:hypothetical protein
VKITRASNERAQRLRRWSSGPSPISARSNDTYVTSKVKARMIDSDAAKSIYVKVVTERRVVYLMESCRARKGRGRAGCCRPKVSPVGSSVFQLTTGHVRAETSDRAALSRQDSHPDARAPASADSRVPSFSPMACSMCCTAADLPRSGRLAPRSSSVNWTIP